MLWNNIKSFQSTQKKHKLTFIFFHPDYTVGFGISPNHAFRLVGYTTGRELHPALKIVIQLRTIIISDIISVNKKFFSRLSKYNNLQAGKHRLFLNILLFGKLRLPVRKSARRLRVPTCVWCRCTMPMRWWSMARLWMPRPWSPFCAWRAARSIISTTDRHARSPRWLWAIAITTQSQHNR